MAHKHNRRSSRGPCGLVLLALLLASPAAAQSFDSGSDGSDGALVVDTNTTLQVPPDGIFNFTTVQVDAGTTLNFTPNSLNTPVYILATGDVNIAGTVHVNAGHGTSSLAGLGGPGGFRGGVPNPVAGPGGPGLGPGAGAGRNAACYNLHPGSYATSGISYSSSVPGPTYGGSLLIPLVGGSGCGGGPGIGGGGGGGAILIASSTLITVSGSVQANGGRSSTSGNGAQNCTGGSGGAVRLVATRVTGGGSVQALGSGYSANYRGGHGRVRIDRLVQSEGIPTVSAGHWVSSSLMLVFPDNLSKLDVTHVAGTDIPIGNPDPVAVFLSNGEPPTQSVTVQAQGFPGSSNVDIDVVLAPTLGTTVTFPGTIPIGNDGTGQLTMDVDFPVNVVTHVQVWTSN